MSIDNVVEKIEFINSDYTKYMNLLKPYHQVIDQGKILSKENVKYIWSVVKELYEKYRKESLESTNLMSCITEIIDTDTVRTAEIRHIRLENEYTTLFKKLEDKKITKKEEKRLDELHFILYSYDH